MTLSDIGLRIATTVWLLALAVQDIRCHRVSHLLTTFPLVVIGLVAMARGITLWLLADRLAVDYLAIALAFLAILASDTWAGLVPASAALGLAFWQGTPESQVVTAGWLVVLAMATAGIIGEGDGKVAMVLMALHPDVRLVITIAVVVLVAGMVILVRRLGFATPFLLLSVIRDAWSGRLPTRGTGTVTMAMVPIIALGASIYLWGSLLW